MDIVGAKGTYLKLRFMRLTGPREARRTLSSVAASRLRCGHGNPPDDDLLPANFALQLNSSIDCGETFHCHS